MDFNDLDYDKITELLKKRDEEEKNARNKKKKLTGGFITVMSLCALCVMTAVWVILEMAAPDRNMMFITTFFDVHEHFTVAPVFRARWNYALVYVAYVLQLISLGTCTIAFVLNLSQKKSKAIKLKGIVIVAGLITVVAFTIFMIRFWYVLF